MTEIIFTCRECGCELAGQPAEGVKAVTQEEVNSSEVICGRCLAGQRHAHQKVDRPGQTEGQQS